MKGIVCALAVVFATHTAAAEPVRTPGRVGLGLGLATIAGGLSLKYFADQKNAFQFVLGDFGGRGYEHRWGHFGGFGFGADYLFEMPKIAKAGDAFELAWNLGGGLGLGYDDDDYSYKDHHYHDYFAFAGAFVAGLEFDFIPVPLDIVLEFRPGSLFVPYVDFNIDFTAHIRVYF